MALLSADSVIPPSSQSASRSAAWSALLAQLLALLISVGLCFTLKAAGVALPHPWLVLLAHASLAAGLAAWRGLAWWWILIEILFPLAFVAALTWQLPPLFSLAAFLLLFISFGAIAATRVPYYPSRASLPKQLLDLLPAEPALHFLDVGSGLGGLLFALGKARSHWRLSGIEVALVPWVVSALKQRWHQQGNVACRFGRYETLDFAKFNVVFAYLSPVVMPEIWNKVQNEMPPGSWFLSYEFSIPGVQADLILESEQGAPPLYVWRL